MARSIDESFFAEERLQALFEAHCEIKEGFPYPNWSALHEEAESLTEHTDLNRYWLGIADAWLTQMQECVGEACDYRESVNFKLLWTDEEVNGEQFLATAEDYLRLIRQRLQGIASNEAYGPHVILLFGDLEQYYSYVGEFFGDREEIVGSAGMMLNRGYAHIALAPNPLWLLEGTLMHELAHCSVCHLNLPRWLDEALAMLIEQCSTGSNCVDVNHYVREEHLKYWNEATIQQFWSGDSFYLDEVSQKHSYQLAEILRRLIVSDIADGPSAFSDFVNEADWRDAGEAAARRHLKVGLGEITGLFLGNGEWVPAKQEEEGN